MKCISNPTLIGSLMGALSRAEIIQLAPSCADDQAFATAVDVKANVRAEWRLHRKIQKALVVNRLDIDNVRIDVKGTAISLNGAVADIGEIEKALTVVRALDGVSRVRAALSIRRVTS